MAPFFKCFLKSRPTCSVSCANIHHLTAVFVSSIFGRPSLYYHSWGFFHRLFCCTVIQSRCVLPYRLAEIYHGPHIQWNFWSRPQECQLGTRRCVLNRHTYVTLSQFLLTAGDGVFSLFENGDLKLVDLKTNTVTVLVYSKDIKNVGFPIFSDARGQSYLLQHVGRWPAAEMVLLGIITRYEIYSLQGGLSQGEYDSEYFYHN